jgi:hypothetical protein
MVIIVAAAKLLMLRVRAIAVLAAAYIMLSMLIAVPANAAQALAAN